MQLRYPLCIVVASIALHPWGFDDAIARHNTAKTKTAHEIRGAVEAARRNTEVERKRSRQESLQRLESLQALSNQFLKSPNLAKPFLVDWLPTDPLAFDWVFGDFRASDSPSSLRTKESRNLFANSWASPQSLIEFRSLVERTSATTKLLIIRGHNTDGDIRLPFKNSEAAPISEIAKICQKNGVLCIILSCSSAKHLDPGFLLFGLERDLTLEKSIELTEFIRVRLLKLQRSLGETEKSALISVQNFAVEIAQETNALIHPRLFLIVLNGTIAGILVSDEDSLSTAKTSALPAALTRFTGRSLTSINHR